MKHKFFLLSFFAWMVLVSSCASYKRQYSKEAEQWEQSAPPSEDLLRHTMYLVGDAGYSSADDIAPVLKYLKSRLPAESKNSSILFLGDNIYEHGMPPQEDVAERRLAEIRLEAQLGITDSFKGRPVFIPGNHDWRGWGLKGLKRQENYVEKYLNKRNGKTEADEWENYFLPDGGCSGPDVVELNDDVVVLVVDSQWWLSDWDKQPKINEGCEARNRATFKFIFENVLRKYRNKHVVIAAHHPLYSYGPHGGGFTAKQHLFPLTELNPNLYIPMPVVGSLSALFRGSIGSRQDLAHQDYKAFRSALLAGAKKNGKFIFVGGHEHTLQSIEQGGQHFIVSGSGSKTSPVRLGKGAEFVTAAAGFSILRFYEGGETWVQFWEVNSDGSEAKLVFMKKIKGQLPAEAEQIQSDFPEYEQGDTLTMQTVSSNEVKPVGKLHKVVFGAHHRDLYLEKYPFPVLDLKTYQGGVIPVKQGGGNQTNSLRVADANGKDYVLRGLTKDASRFLPFPFNKMAAAKYLVEDNFLSTHPFAPLAVPSIAEAISVYHTNPTLYYIPAQPALGPFNSIFGGKMHLVEERPDGKNWKDAAWFGNPDKIVSTPELVESMLQDNKHRVDEAWALRTRMLDFLIGDWDRHDDQWVWACINQDDGTKLYRPIPRDRDQAFSRYDGLVTNVARQTLPFLRQLQTYGPSVRSVKWSTWSARLYDHTFLNGLSWEQWEAQVRFVQEQLTDEIIENAFRDWPEKARAMSAPHIISSLKSRRNNLMEIARKHYEFLGKSVDVIGTDERERFVVERLDDRFTRVTVYELSKKGEIKERIFQRTFDRKITKAVNLYGNGDKDEFVVEGKVRKGMKVRLIGGLEPDEFTDRSEVGKGSKKTLVFDDLQSNTLKPGTETRDKRNSLYRYNIYDRRGYDSEYNFVLPVPIVGYNPDDGFLLGPFLNITKYGFKKEPYASSQQIGGRFAFRTAAFKLTYEGDFPNMFGNWDLYLDISNQGPTYSFNFAGIGNESFREKANNNFYRVRQTGTRLYPAFKKRFAGSSGYITLGPLLETSRIEATPGRFITAYGSDNPALFKRKYFGGTEFSLVFNNVDNFFLPHQGIRFKSTLNWTTNLAENKNFTVWRVQLAFYKHLDYRENIVFATQIGGGQNVGTGYEFFQMQTIGGQQGLRGYRTERFYGKSSLWHNTDLRVRLSSSYNSTLPLTFGVFGGFDYGRVWLEEDESTKWHYNYGGGLWVSPVDVLVFSLGAFIPGENTERSPRIVFQAGFGF